MNWAIIAREDRLYKGKTLFRWDVSPGLEHHCGTCATPLHNARSKSTCIGKHVEPCFRFHQQLHFLGKSHECAGCNTSDEMHHTRHKEILTIVREINGLDGTESAFNSHFNRRRDDDNAGQTESDSVSPEMTDLNSEISLGDEALTRRERKKAKKMGRKCRKDMEIFGQEDINCISEALHLSVHESKGAWWGTYAYDNRYSETREKIETLKEEDMEKEENDYAVQPPTPVSSKGYKAPNYPTPKQQKAARKSEAPTPIRQSKLRGHQQRYNPDSGSANDPYGGVDREIFYRLGIDVDPGVNYKSRRDLVAKLIAAIKNDLAIVRREEEEAVIREEGFWRWAGRNAFRNIKEYRKDFDWATGQKRVKTEAEIFGTEEEGYADDLGELEDEDDSVETIEEVQLKLQMDVAKDPKEEQVERMRGYKLANEDRKMAEGGRKKREGEVSVLRITTVPPDPTTCKPRLRLTKTVKKTKKTWSYVGPEQFIDNEQTVEDGLGDLVAKFGNTNMTPKPTSWAGVAGLHIRSSIKAVSTDTPVATTSNGDGGEDDWTTVGKKGKKERR